MAKDETQKKPKSVKNGQQKKARKPAVKRNKRRKGLQQ